MYSIVRKVRNMKCYTQQYVAKEIGISLKTFARKESNPNLFTVAEIKKLAKVLNVKEEIFFADELTLEVS